MVAELSDGGLPGEWLRQSRLAAGLTQEGLAARSGVSVRTISNLERAVSARPYPRLIRLLADALALPHAFADEVIASYRRDGIPVRRQLRTAESDSSGLLALPAESEPTGGAEHSVPRCLLARVWYFTGRSGELAELSSWLYDVGSADDAVVISAISGSAGVGKTALALHWAHRAAPGFADGQLYTELRGFDQSGTPVAPGEALGELLSALGTPPHQIPPGLAGRSALYRSQLAGKRVLIVLDDARDEEQVRPLLPGSPGCLVIITSRSQLSGLAASDGARVLPLGLLSEADARQLLAARLGGDRAAAEPAAVTKIVGLCSCLPLALAITAARAVANPQLPLAALAAELADMRGRLDVLDAGDPAVSVRAAFSCSYRNLTEPGRQMFCFLGLHPGPDISVSAAASLAGTTLARARRDLNELARASLITEHTPGRYAFHDLLRAYATEQATASRATSLRHGTVRMLDHYLHTAHAASLLLRPSRNPITLIPPAPRVTLEQLNSAQEALEWFEADRKALIAIVALADETRSDAYAWQIPWAMTDYLDWRGHWHDWAVTQRIALAAATRLGDPAAQGAVRLIFGQASARLGRYDQAKDHLTEALDHYQQLDDHASEARIHQMLSYVAIEQSRYVDGLRHAEQELTLYQSAFSLVGQASALNDIGWCHAQLGDYQRARSCCQEALALHRRLGDPRHEAKDWDSLGHVERLLGRPATAAFCYERALGLVRELGDRFSEADVLTHLGDCHHFAGDALRARDAWQQALDILDRMHHPHAEQIRAKLKLPNWVSSRSAEGTPVHA